MKKAIFVVCAIALSLAMIGCGTVAGSKSSSKSSIFPDFVTEARDNASEDIMVGVGAYTFGNDKTKFNHAKAMAETRARADLSRQLDVVVKTMVNDTTISSEFDEAAKIQFSADVTQTLSKAKLTGSRTKGKDQDGIYWAWIEYSISGAKSQISTSAKEAANRLAIPSAVNNAFQEKMDDAFKKQEAIDPNFAIGG